jgi:hypothetical protein
MSDVFSRHFVEKIHQASRNIFSYSPDGLNHHEGRKIFFDTGDGICHQGRWKSPTIVKIPRGFFYSA